jgi:hypothetical protein
MPRKAKRSRLHINNHISRSQALAFLAQNDIHQSIVPAVVVEGPHQSPEEAEHVDQVQNEEGGGPAEMVLDDNFCSFSPSVEASDSDSDVSFSLTQDGSFPPAEEDLCAGASYSAEQQLNVTLGGNQPTERSRQSGEQEEEKEKLQEEEELAPDSGDEENWEEDMVELDAQEQAMLDLLRLCQDAGTSLEFFDTLVTTLRRHGKKGFDIRKACTRQTFLDNLRKKISCPRPVITQVGTHQVPTFNLLEQIIDLLNSVLFDDLSNLCVNLSPSDRFSTYQATTADCYVEVFASRWYRSTDQEFVKDPDLEFLLPLIFYIDETGTDAFQRYPLEPLMFTFALIRRHMREKSCAWRHAGFVPKVSGFDTSLEGLQMYHDCLSVLLADLEELQANPPIVKLNLGGMKKRVKIILQVAFVMGDQKSQDTLCGRKKSNSGGAARVHRGCMCSSLHGSDSTTKCHPVSKVVLDHLRDIAFEDRHDSVSMTAAFTKLPMNVRGNAKKQKHAVMFIKRRSRLARDILGKTYTMHGIRNAFDRISFGTNSNKIFSATLVMTLSTSATLVFFSTWDRLAISACKIRSVMTLKP